MLDHRYLQPLILRIFGLPTDNEDKLTVLQLRDLAACLAVKDVHEAFEHKEGSQVFEVY